MKKYQLNLKNNPYQKSLKSDIDQNFVLYDKADTSTRQQVLKSTLVELNFRALVGMHYNLITTTKVKYKIFKGAKGTKKSETIIAWIIFQVITRSKYNAIVLRRYLSDHQDTTVAGFSTVLKRIKALFGWDYEKFFKLSSPQANVPYIWFNRFGLNGKVSERQEVRLLSWENDNGMASQKWFNGGFCGTLHWEEPLEKPDMKKGGAELTDEFMREKWPIIEETLLRYDTITNKDMPYQEVIMSFNSWNKHHFVVKDYVSAFIHENEEMLEMYGKQEYMDTDAHAGQGTYIMLMTWKVNEFRTPNEIKMIFALKKRNYRDYRTIYLGLDYIFSGGVLSDIWHMAKVVEDTDGRLPDQIKFGGDWSSSKDKSGLLMVKVWYSSNGLLEKIRFTNPAVFDKMKGHDIKRANALLDYTDRALEPYKFQIENGVMAPAYALLDNRDAFWIDWMNTNKTRLTGAGQYISYLGANKHDTHKNAAGLLSRAFALRGLIIAGIAEFSPEAYQLINEEAETLEWIDEGKISDGKDDVFQMAGYGISDQITLIAKSTGVCYN